MRLRLRGSDVHGRRLQCLGRPRVHHEVVLSDVRYELRFMFRTVGPC